jgi:hypothetical protein
MDLRVTKSLGPSSLMVVFYFRNIISYCFASNSPKQQLCSAVELVSPRLRADSGGRAGLV